MDKINATIEMLEDLEMDEPTGVYPIFDDTVYYGYDYKEVNYDPLDKKTEKGPLMVFGWKPFEKVFMRRLDYREMNGKIFFRTREVEEKIKQNQENNFGIRNYPCFLK